MAIATYRYKLVGPTMEMIGDLVPGAVVVQSIVSCDTVDIAVDDSMKEDLDEAMSDYGYAPTVYDASTPPTYGLKSPDGSIWNLYVDDSGSLTTKKQQKSMMAKAVTTVEVKGEPKTEAKAEAKAELKKKR